MDNEKRLRRSAMYKAEEPEFPAYMRSQVRSSASRASARTNPAASSVRINTPAQQRAHTSSSPQPSANRQQAAPVAAASSHAGSAINRSTGGNTWSTSTSRAGQRSTQGGGGSRGGGNRGNGSGQPRKKRVTRAQKMMRLSIAIFGALILVVAGILLIRTFGSESVPGGGPNLEGKTYFAGITIEGVNVAEKTIEEAKPLVQRAIEDRIGAVSIVIPGDEYNWSITGADLGLSANVDDILQEALAYGRDGSFGENADAKQLAVHSGKSFNAPFTYDEQKLLSRLNTIAADANLPATEPQLIPSLTESNGQFVQNFEPVPGSNGRMLNVAAMAEAIGALIENKQLQASVDPIYDAVEPSLTVDFLLANTSRIATFSTNFAKSSSNETIKNRCFNIEKASTRINCHVVNAGEEFSFNGWVGPRTKDTGWKEANGISKGKEFTLQYGGGICQVSTTLYGALIRGKLNVTDRRQHTIPSDYVPYGQDATVDTSGIDLKFINNTEAPIYIFSYIKPYKDRNNRLEITVSLYGQALPEGVIYEPETVIVEEILNEEVEREEDSAIPVGYEMERYQHRKGYIVEVYLVKKVNGVEESRERLNKDKYNGNKQRILVGTGDPATVPVPEGAVPVGSIGAVEDTIPGDTAEAVPVQPGDQPAA